MGLFDKLFGTHSERELKKIDHLVNKVEALESLMQQKSDSELRELTNIYKERIASGETLDDILPEAFATAREASRRVLGMRPYRVQIIGGIVLHQGRIAEMKTGEGKTLVAVMPAYLNALEGKGVHIVTVNDYLAKRDSEWMGKVYRFLGLEVGLIVHGLSSEERKIAYNADITYGTNNEMGFDYLRDNMALYSHDMVQRSHHFAIVDEVDSILIDEARTPLIISGQGDESTDLYRKADALVRSMRSLVVTHVDDKAEEDENINVDYVVDEKAKTATLTARGTEKSERYFGIENLSDLENSTIAHHINQSLKAYGTMKKDIDYVVKDGEVIIVDEFTGRLMFGRRYSEGLHQAIEAKERVDVQKENKTLATITFQNYFRLYKKLSGMTGTALTEAEEFETIYSLDIIEIPTNKPVIRIDNADVVYKNENGKNRAIIEQIITCHEKGQPVLVGTISIEKSEEISSLLKKCKIEHNVLNAKQHDKEAEIVAQAGKFGAVTIATNMAGRGTDIVLGGNAEFLAKKDLKSAGFTDEIIAEATGYSDTSDGEVLKARAMFADCYSKHKKLTDAEAERVKEVGGLYILGTERHESRRIDNQLRGRSGRQGDPGESRFYIALTDDIMRLFGSERIMGAMEKLGMEEDMPLDNKLLSNSIEQAQKTVESRNFQIRKNVIEFDDVMNVQRNLIYGERHKVLFGDDIKDYIFNMLEEFVLSTVSSIDFSADGAVNEALSHFKYVLLSNADIFEIKKELGSDASKEDVEETILEKAIENYESRENEFGLMPDGRPFMRELERVVLLRVVDEYWMEHLESMNELRRGVGLRGYGNEKPVDAYKREGYEIFDAMVGGIKEETVRRLFTVRVRKPETLERKSVAKNIAAGTEDDGTLKKTPVKKAKKPGRNDPCPCGKLRPNGLPMKYKDCCGRNR